MRKKIATTIYVTAQQKAALDRLSARTKVPAAEYIRQGIDWVLDREGEPPYAADVTELSEDAT